MAINQKIENKVGAIREALQAAGFAVSERKRGIRVKTDTGCSVDIFSLKSNPDQVRARVKLDKSDPLKRQAIVELIQNSLSAALNGKIRVDSFRFSRETEGLFFYNAVLETPAGGDSDEPIEISAEAVQILDADEPGDLAAADDSEFRLDFDFKEDSRLKVGKSLAEEAMEVLETVDSKMLRQSLDMMSLKRSSVVRLAVTRICREATDVEELENAVRSEAKKIVTPEDRIELQNLKSLSTNGFLDPIVDLLWQEVFNDAY